jgi:hypothetical protein
MNDVILYTFNNKFAKHTLIAFPDMREPNFSVELQANKNY